MGSLKLVSYINEFCGCSLDVDLIVSQEATTPYICPIFDMHRQWCK